MSEFQKTVNIKNRKASFEYQFIDKFTAGIVLTGTEVKSVRESKVNLQHAYCTFKKDELYIREMHISPYKLAAHYNHEATRERKLLLNRQELKKLMAKSQEKGLTIIPVRLFINDRGLIKIEIALAKGKKLYDKREDIKQKDIKREMARIKI
ncbi:MAG: SsrA-binding protein SmpB [Cyclobacteriaceae bacterium]|nr:SsrA-binding protein SmpB [Cyclobacteriaceae bacterium]